VQITRARRFPGDPPAIAAPGDDFSREDKKLTFSREDKKLTTFSTRSDLSTQLKFRILRERSRWW